LGSFGARELGSFGARELGSFGARLGLFGAVRGYSRRPGLSVESRAEYKAMHVAITQESLIIFDQYTENAYRYRQRAKRTPTPTGLF
jgi:hypothetical protein